MNQTDVKPWYKQVWPWLIISLPLITVIAGVITYKIAAHNPDSMVKDDYFKEGLAINQSLAKQQLAKQHQLIAEINFDSASQLIIVKLSSNPFADQSLKLELAHPTQKRLDQALVLEQLSELEFVGQLNQLTAAYWHVKLYNHNASDAQTRWALSSRAHLPEQLNIRIDANTR